MAKLKKVVSGLPPRANVDMLNNTEMEEQFAINAMMTRSNILSTLLDPRRDIDDECGYKEEITIDNYQFMFDREGVGTRVVEVWPYETWKVQPNVFEDEDMDTETEFEKAWQELSKGLLAEDGESWYQDQEGSPIWEYLRRVDILSGIGHFGILLLGFNDGKEMREEISPSDNNELLYIRCYPESLVDITQWETDNSNPRYGKPLMYNITLNDPKDSQAGIGAPASTIQVHHSRVIHIADGLASSEIVGAPRMKPVWNRLVDLRKLYGGSAEMYWRGAFPGFSLETHPQLGGDVSIDTQGLKESMENYQNGLQRYMALMGMTAKSLAPQVVDPTPQIKIQLEALCIRIGVPMRVFLGSERGELSSTQDKDTWNGRIQDRQTNYVTPRIIVRFIDRLISLGVLPTPEGYSVDWPDLDSLTPVDASLVALQKTEAMSKYVAGGVDTLMEPQNFLVKVVGFSEDEAEEILKATEDHVAEEEQKMEEEQLKMDDEQLRRMDDGLEPDTRIAQDLQKKALEAPVTAPGGGAPTSFPPKKKGAKKDGQDSKAKAKKKSHFSKE